MSGKVEKLTQIKLKFDHYRATRTKREALPKELWDDAVALTSEFSFFEVSKTLKVNYARLKELAEEAVEKLISDTTRESLKILSRLRTSLNNQTSPIFGAIDRSHRRQNNRL